ncbi:MAG: DHH family phosphoesterase [Nanoarchaeota archaeon]|nr:DHH family phosphoesterase [Nanoarchaeota archaeon]
MNKVIITSYQNVDLDGFSSSLAYHEYLKHKNIISKVRFHGKPHREVDIISKKYNIKYILDNYNDYHDKDIILVDHSSPSHISPHINLINIKYILDHRRIHEAHKFSNAKVHIEKVGSCATLVTEKFIKINKNPSKICANLLYTTIMSNTLKLKANVTTTRDIKAVTFLKNIISIDEKNIDEFFIEKSIINDIDEAIEEEYAIFEDLEVGFAQIEIADTEKFLKKNKQRILNKLNLLKERENVRYSLLNLVDIIKGTHIIVTESEFIQDKLKKKNFKFYNKQTKESKALFRKEIITFLK